MDLLNFQLRIYEGTNDIAFHFGPSRIDRPDLDYGEVSGPSIGVLKVLIMIRGDAAGVVMLVDGNPSNPTVFYSY